MSALKYVGQRLPKADALDKVTGRAVYINDLARPGMLHGKILYAAHAHALIKSLDVSKARALPGVRAVLTGQDIPEIPLGFMRDNRPLKKGKVRTRRDEIAAVAATSPDIAQEAIELIEVEYEPLPALFSPEEALAEGAPLIHELDAKGRPAKSNKLSLPWKLICGDVEEGRARARHIAQGTYRTTWISHCCLGTSGVIAEFDLNRNLTMHSITQIPYLAQNDYLEALKAMGLPSSQVRVLCQTIGGGFGSKLDTHCYEFIAILLARATGRPVKMQFSREEEFLAQATRQPATMEISQGCDAEGRLTFREVHMLLDNGGYTSWGATTPSVMMVPVSSLYRVPNVRYLAESVYTNNIYAQAMRGYGNPQATFAIESNLDQLALMAGMDPVEFRLINANQPGDQTPQGFKITTCGLSQCIEKVRQGLGWQEHQQAKARGANVGGHKARGQGLASLIHVGGGARVYRSDGHGMIMKLDDFGRLTVFTGAVEIGQGNETILRQVAAEAVGLKLEDVSIVSHDTAICPWDVGTHASRAAFISGNAAIQCAQELRRKIFALAAQQLEVEPEDLDLSQGQLLVRRSGGGEGQRLAVAEADESLPLAKVLRKAHFSSGGRMLMAETFYDPPNEMLDREFKGNLSCSYAFGASGVEVEVDTQTGQVRILKYLAAHDVGRALNPMLLEGQIYGGSLMGVGMALTEEVKLHEGRVVNGNFLDYKMLTCKDAVPITPIIVETDDPAGPYGAKGVGEPGCVPSAPAIANAIFDAVGVRIHDLPITPEKVLRALQQKKDEVCRLAQPPC
ncbi:MAG: molybdopterin-dependent oxidoreductase [Desulfarculus sp.]|nr:molybdopterin-dependent oxidoreductase [Desulfarculus sp.]